MEKKRERKKPSINDWTLNPGRDIKSSCITNQIQLLRYAIPWGRSTVFVCVSDGNSVVLMLKGVKVPGGEYQGTCLNFYVRFGSKRSGFGTKVPILVSLILALVPMSLVPDTTVLNVDF